MTKTAGRTRLQRGGKNSPNFVPPFFSRTERRYFYTRSVRNSALRVACAQKTQKEEPEDGPPAKAVGRTRMFEIYREEVEWGGRTLRLETGRIARQADGAVLAKYGETTVLATVVAEREADPTKDFFPLTVNYQEKAYAAGKIPGGYFKREGRPTERETLVSRLIDRPIRPLFAPGFKNETQVIVTVLSHDMENDPDILALVAASAALTLSGVPFLGPIGASRVGYAKGQYILNPSSDQIKNTELDLVVAGTGDAVLMVESEAKELSEEVMLGAVVFGQEGYRPVIEAIIGLAEQAAKEPWNLPDAKNEFETKVKKLVEKDLKKAFQIAGKQERNSKVGDAKAKAVAELVTPEIDGGRQVEGRRCLQGNREERRPLKHPENRQAYRRPRPRHGPPHRLPGWRDPAHPWLGAVHARRDAGAGGCHAWHGRG